MVTDSLQAGKSDKEVVLESLLALERADAQPSGTSATVVQLESQLALERDDRIRKQAANG